MIYNEEGEVQVIDQTNAALEEEDPELDDDFEGVQSQDSDNEAFDEAVKAAKVLF